MLENTANRSYLQWVPSTSPIEVTINFGINNKDDIYIYFINEDFSSLTKLILDVDYSITIYSNETFVLYFTQMMVDAFTESGYIGVLRETDLKQLMSFQEGGILKLKTLESSIDKLTMITQDLTHKNQLSLSVPWEDMIAIEDPQSVYEPQVLNLLPTIANRKNKYLKFDDEGQPEAVTVIDVSEIDITQLGECVVGCETQECARTCIDAAYIEGDATTNFQVADPVAQKDAVNLEYLNTQLDNILPEAFPDKNYIQNATLQVFTLNDLCTLPVTFNHCAYIIDRWKLVAGSFLTNSTCEVQYTRSTDVPVLPDDSFNSSFSQKIVVNTILAGEPAPGDRWGIWQSIEDRKCVAINNTTVSFGFWIKCSQIVQAPDKLCAAFVHRTGGTPDTYQSYVHEFEVTSVDTWEYKTFDIPLMDGIGGNNGDEGLGVYICIGTSSTNCTTTPDIWVNSTVPYYGTTNLVELEKVQDASVTIANMTLIPGSNALPVDGSYLPYEDFCTQVYEAARFFVPLTTPTNIFIRDTVGANYTGWFTLKFNPFLARVGTIPIYDYTYLNVPSRYTNVKVQMAYTITTNTFYLRVPDGGTWYSVLEPTIVGMQIPFQYYNFTGSGVPDAELVVSCIGDEILYILAEDLY